MPVDPTPTGCACRTLDSDPVVAQLNPSSDNGSRRPTLRAREAAFVREHWNGDGVVVELMCGVGNYQHALACRRYLGLDTDPRMLRAAAARGVAELLVADVRRLPLRSRRFADLVVWAYEGMNAFPAEQSAAVLADAIDRIRPGGYLLLDVGQFDSGLECATVDDDVENSRVLSGCDVCGSQVSELVTATTEVSVRTTVQLLPGAAAVRSTRWYPPVASVTQLLTGLGCEILAAESLHRDCDDSDVPDTHRSVQILAAARHAA